MKPSRLLPVLAFLLAACLWERSERIAGGTSETSNGDIQARVAYSDGRPAAHVHAVVVDDSGWLQRVADGRPVAVETLLTDGAGRLTLKLRDCSRCNLQLEGESEGGFVRDVKALAEAGKSDTLDLSLAPYGHVRGWAKGDSAAEVRLAGTSYAAPVDTAYVFPRVPPGLYALVSVREDGTVDAFGGVASGTAIRVESDSSIIGPSVGGAPTRTFGSGVFATWPYWRKLAVQVPADVPDTALAYPLLVRLHADNFDFSQASARDIRFSDARGFEVPHAVTSYDSAGRRAEIWVLARYARGRADSLTFLWGKPGVLATSNSHGVMRDYSSVWHFNARALSGPSITFIDGAAGQNDLKGVTAPGIAGYVGEGIRLDGGQVLAVPADSSLMPDTALTLSAWIRPEAGPGEMTIAALASNYILRLAEDGKLVFLLRDDSTVAGYVAPPEPWAKLVAEGPSLRDGEWHHVAGVYDGSAMRLYVDGKPVAEMARTGRIVYPVAGDFTIGGRKDCACHPFVGGMDEVRVSPQAFTPGRMRMESEAQR